MHLAVMLDECVTLDVFAAAEWHLALLHGRFELLFRMAFVPRNVQLQFAFACQRMAAPVAHQLPVAQRRVLQLPVGAHVAPIRERFIARWLVARMCG